MVKSQICQQIAKSKAAGKAAKEAERRRADERKRRKVVLTTDQVDEIVAKMESLIDMMEPYWSQGGADKDARELIDWLNALADGTDNRAAYRADMERAEA